MITVYSKPHCPHCVAAKNYLTNHGIPFNEIDVTTHQPSLDFIRAQGHKTVPQLYVGETLLVEGGNAGLQKIPADEIRKLVTTLRG